MSGTGGMPSGCGVPPRSSSRACSSSGLPAPARTTSRVQAGEASGKASRTSPAAAVSLSGASVWVRTRDGDSAWVSPAGRGSTSYWLRSVATSSTGNRSTCRAASVSQRREDSSARWTSSTATSTGPSAAYARSSRHSRAALPRSSPPGAMSVNSGTGPRRWRTMAKGTEVSSGEQRTRSTRRPRSSACRAAVSSTAVRPVPVAPRSRTRRPVPARARSISAASSAWASSRSRSGPVIGASCGG